MDIPLPTSRHRIVVTGMALCNALGHNVDDVWRHTLEMRSGLVRLTPQPGDPPHFFDAPFTPGVNSYCDVAALCHISLTRHDLQLPPQDFSTMPASTRLTLYMAQQAMADSGLPQAGYDPERVGVFISQNAGESASTLWDLNLSLRAAALAELAAKHGNWDDNTRLGFQKALQDGRQRPSEGSMLCRINCMAAGILCRRYGFTGPAFSVGAACSSSMAALFTALNLLRNGSIDAAVIGGGEEMYAPLYLAEFAALGALARPGSHIREPQDYSRPFDAHRNGFVLGEGAAMLVLEREDTARQRSAPLHGMITGMGHVTNGKGLIEPDAHAQIRAIRTSFAGLDYGPDDVDLVEAHATSTIQGDLEEGRALTSIYGYKHRPTVLSAYKGQIGHTTGASGVTAIIHGLLSMRDGLYPGTLNCEEPDPAIPLGEGNLRLYATPDTWERPASGIRRMQINSFAFGGACFALQMEEPNDRRVGAAHSAGASLDTAGTPGKFAGHEDVVHGVRLITLPHMGEEWRMGSTAPNWIAELAGLPPAPSEEDLAALARKGLWLHKSDTPPPVAVMCCGQGSVWPGMGRALYDTFPAARAAMDRIAAVAQWDVLKIMDEKNLERIVPTRWQQPYIFLLEYAQACCLESLGFTPTVMSGHSLGELIALCLAGVYTPEQAWYILDTRATYMSKLEAQAPRDMGMMAVHAPAMVVDQTLRDFPDLCISNYNTPTQFILSGPRDILTEARRSLRKNRTPAILLNVSMAFHHPSMRALRELSVAELNRIDMRAPRLPMYSNISTGLYPDDPASICEYMGDLDENSVRWVECVRNMWNNHGVRHFVEFGPADTLCSLTADIEPQAQCISAGRKDREVEGMRTAIARLYALGHLPRRTLHAVPSSPSAQFTANSIQARTKKDSAPVSGSIEAPPHVEEIMPLIMEATGYERHELGPDMDLRHDLAIRSSRFPLIMSAAEDRFGITVRFEDLMGVATIRDLADVLARLRQSPITQTNTATAEDTAQSEEDCLLPILRFVPDQTALDMPDSPQDLLTPSPVLVVGSLDLAQRWTDFFKKQFGQDHVRAVSTVAQALVLLEQGFTPRALALADSPSGADKTAAISPTP